MTPRRAVRPVGVLLITPKLELVCAPVAKLYVRDVFGLLGLKWLSALKASTRNSSVFRSASRKSFARDISRLNTPGPYVSVGGVLPMPSESIAGKVKLVALNGTCNPGSSVFEGYCPEGR